MREDKVKRLKQLLSQLSTRQAVALAGGIETERALGHETLPSETILEALRPQLRQAGAKRVPTLRRLACATFEDFLTDRRDDPRPPGVIARSAIDPWWRALRHVAGPEIQGLEEELKQVIARHDQAGIAALAETVARAARGWTEKILAQLAERDADPALKALFADPALLTDLQEIARVLPLGGAVKSGIDAVIRAAGQSGEAQGRHLANLGPAAVKEAKQQYLRFNDTFGGDVRYFALGLLNKLERGWQILRLGRALSGEANDAMVQDTEFGIIGERLIGDLKRQARDILALTESTEATRKLAQLKAWLADYVEDAEGLLGEFGFHRDSAWGEAILKTRAEIARAIGGALTRIADTVLAVLPQTRRAVGQRMLRGPDLAQPADAAITAAALDGARLLFFLLKTGERHGFGVATHKTVEHIGDEIDRRVTLLLDELRKAPQNPVIPAQIEAAKQVADSLFEDGRGELLLRRLRNAQHALKPRATAYGLTR